MNSLLEVKGIKKELLSKGLAREERDNEFHIAFGVDNGYVWGMGITMTSLIMNNPEMNYTFHIFSALINHDHRELLAVLSRRTGARVILYSFNEYFTELKATERFSHAIYYRLLAPVVLDKIAEKVLYLDADIVCLNDISGLQRIDMSASTVAVVSDHEQFVKTVKIPELNLQFGQYFNSGFLLIDVNKWNDENITQLVFALLRERMPPFKFPDQDALNVILDGKALFLNRRWNVLYSMDQMSHDIPVDTVFLHYTGDVKPWHATCRHNLQKQFLEYSSESPWADMELENPATYKAMRRYARILLKEKNIVHSIYWYCKYAITKALVFTKKWI